MNLWAATRTVRIGCAVGALAVLAACTPPPPMSSFRDDTIRLSASTRFDPTSFAGTWHVLAHLGTKPEGTYQFAYDKTDKILIQSAPKNERYTVPSAGVLDAIGTPQTLVIMWVDEGFRTAAIGTRDGVFGAILDRQPRGSADRFNAAIQILKFNGWDVSQLKKVKK